MDKQAAFRAIAWIEAEITNPQPYGRRSEFWNTPPTIRDVLSRLARGLRAYVLATRDPDVIRAAQSISISDVEGLLAMDLPTQYLNHARVCLNVLRDIAAMNVAGDTPAAGALLQLPSNLNTQRAQMYILKAVKAGLVELTTTSARWIGGTQALLAYFCQRVYCENDNGTDNGQPFPESALNQFWGASRLGKARSQNANNKNTNGKPKGHQNIDNLFEYEAAN